MKKGAALSLELAPAGTAMFWVTQAGCAIAAGTSQTAESKAPVRAANVFFIFRSPVRESDGSSSVETVSGG